MWLTGITISTLLCSTFAERNITIDVQALVSKFRVINKNKDIINGLEHLGERSRELFSLAGPVQDLLFATLNSSKATSKEEDRALSELRKLFEEIKVDANRSSDGYFAYENTAMFYSDLSSLTAANRSVNDSESVIRKIKQEMYGIFIDGDFDEEDFNPDYSVQDPGIFPTRMAHHDLIKCRQPNEQELAKMTRVRDALHRLETRLNVSLDGVLDEISWYNDIFALSLRATPDHVEKMVLYIDQSVPTPTAYQQEAQEILDNFKGTSFIKTIQEARDQVANSILNRATNYLDKDEDTEKSAKWFYTCSNGGKWGENITTYEFNTTVLLSKMREVHSDIMRLVLLNALLGTQARKYDMSPPTGYNYTEGSLKGLNRTGLFLAQFARDIQDLSWPGIGIETAKNAIDNGLTPSLNEAARSIRNALEKQASKVYSYQVVVLPTIVLSNGVSVDISDVEDNENYASVIDFNALDVHIFRFNKTNFKQAEKTQKWADEKLKALSSAFR